MGHSVDHPTPAPPATFADLDGTNGFAVYGVNPYDLLGGGASGSGDVNGDGLDDLLVSTSSADLDGVPYTGAGYVIFGKTGEFTAVFDLTTLDGNNGFRLDGALQDDFAGSSIANAGDVNGDGLADVIIGAPGADPDGKLQAGSSYVVLGSKQGWSPNVELAALNGDNGFRIDSATPGNLSGYHVSSAGDFNGDGFDDVIMEAPGEPGSFQDPWEYYVVFGDGQGFPAILNLASLDGNNGFKLLAGDGGPAFNLGSAGDINGDGFDDISVMRFSLDCSNFFECTSEHVVSVVFGTDQGFASSFDLTTIDGNNGFVITPIPGGFFAYAINGVGDFNGDGLADLAISDFFQNGSNGLEAGHIYIIFGTTQGFPADLDVATLDGSNGFRIEGAANDMLGSSVSGTDINGDGYDDIIITPFDYGSNDYIYVVYGGDDQFQPIVDITALDQTQAFQIAIDPVIDGDSNLKNSDAGDVNGDGFGDFLIGSPVGKRDDLTTVGMAVTVFGDDFTASVTHAGGVADDALVGTPGGDVMVGGLGDDILDGRGGADVLTGGTGDDVLTVSDAGFQRLDGGGGRDRLKVDGFDLDLTATPDLRVRGIEIIDLGDAGANQVTLALRDLRTMSETSNTITIVGDNGDHVVIDLTGTGFQPIDRGNGFIEYTAQSADNGLSLLVQDSLDLSGIIF